MRSVVLFTIGGSYPAGAGTTLTDIGMDDGTPLWLSPRTFLELDWPPDDEE
nr:hypothetical protein StreXyl84_78690 [Streptomyces sp. Xyl84]